MRPAGRGIAAVVAALLALLILFGGAAAYAWFGPGPRQSDSTIEIGPPVAVG